VGMGVYEMIIIYSNVGISDKGAVATASFQRSVGRIPAFVTACVPVGLFPSGTADYSIGAGIGGLSDS
jgi:hypothetical protein